MSSLTVAFCCAPDFSHAYTMVWVILFAFLSAVSVPVLPMPAPNEPYDPILSSDVNFDRSCSSNNNFITHHGFLHPTGFEISTSYQVESGLVRTAYEHQVRLECRALLLRVSLGLMFSDTPLLLYILSGVPLDFSHTHIMVRTILFTFLSVVSASILPLPSSNEPSLTEDSLVNADGLRSSDVDSGIHHGLIYPTGFSMAILAPVWCQTNGHCCPSYTRCPEVHVCPPNMPSQIVCCPAGVTHEIDSGHAENDQFRDLRDRHSCSCENGIPTSEEVAFVTIVRRQGTGTGPPATAPTTAPRTLSSVAPPPPVSPPVVPPISTTVLSSVAPPPPVSPPVVPPISTTVPPPYTSLVTSPVASPVMPPVSSPVTTPVASAVMSSPIPSPTDLPPPIATTTAMESPSLPSSEPSPTPITSSDPSTTTSSPIETPTSAALPQSNSSPIPTTTIPTLPRSPSVTSSTITSASIAAVPTNATVEVSSPEIVYNGNWTFSAPVCEATVSGVQCEGAGNVFSYEFRGTAIYLSVGTGPDGGLFSVELDGQSWDMDSYMPDAISCRVELVALDHLENQLHTISLTTLGRSPSAPDTSSGGLQIEDIVVTKLEPPPSPPPRSSAVSIGPSKGVHMMMYGIITWFIMATDRFLLLDVG